MPFALDSQPSPSEMSEAINYLLGNLAPGLSANPDTGQITAPTGNVVAYLYKYLAVKYADSFDGSLNFSNSPTNRGYYGLRNSDDPTESTNPADYVWYKVSGGFSTNKFLFYLTTGGRSINIVVSTAAPTDFYKQDDGSSIDLDFVTSAPASPSNFAVIRVAADFSPPTDAEVLSAIGRLPIDGDLCIVNYSSGTASIQYRYSGGWYLFQKILTGDLVVANSIVGGNIAANTITGSLIAGNTVAASNMVTGTITAASGIIANAAITNALIADASISTAKIIDANITTAKIGTAQIDTLRIAGNAVTVPVYAQLASQVTNPPGGSITALSATTDTGGQPIVVVFNFTVGSFPGGTDQGYVAIWIGGTKMREYFVAQDPPVQFSGVVYLATPPSGSFNVYVTLTAASSGFRIRAYPSSTTNVNGTYFYCLGTKR